jgi:hypothetical protein
MKYSLLGAGYFTLKCHGVPLLPLRTAAELLPLISKYWKCYLKNEVQVVLWVEGGENFL